MATLGAWRRKLALSWQHGTGASSSIVALAALIAAAAVVGVTLLQTRGEQHDGSRRGDQAARPGSRRSRSISASTQRPRRGRSPAPQSALQREARRAGRRDLRPLPLAARRRSARPSPSWTRQRPRDACRASQPRTRASPVAQLHLGMGRLLGRPRTPTRPPRGTRRVDTRFADSPYGVKAEDAPAPDAELRRPAVRRARLPAPADDPASCRPRRAARRARRAPRRSRTPGRSSCTARALWQPRAHRSRPSGSSRLPRGSRRTTRSRAPPRPSARSRRRTRCSAFARLGPLTGVFPRAAGRPLPSRPAPALERRAREGAAQLRLAAADAPHSSYAQDAHEDSFRVLPGTRSK